MRIATMIAALALSACAATTTPAGDRVHISGGAIEGAGELASGVRAFYGVPFAAPPVGPLRFREPQPVAAWEGVREAKSFGPRCMQIPIFADMVFRSPGISEDCLYLNVWTPARDADAKLPVLVYFYGGGFIAGDASEPRYDGEALAAQGVVVVTTNYRLGLFGFLAHPELSAESPRHASGNYALLDQHAALAWVRDNIAAFGGDPTRVTIAGESAGSVSVSAQMASPMSRDLIAGAIGESGSLLGTLPPNTLAEAERLGAELGDLASLRALSAEELMGRTAPFDPRHRPVLDGAFLPKAPRDIFAAGEQARVPLLVGSNSAEGGPEGVLGAEAPTLANYRAALARLYPDHAEAVFAAYPADADGDAVLAAAQALASDRFIGASTWRWADLSAQTGGAPVYCYYYDHPRAPLAPGAVSPYGPQTSAARGAPHAVEIEYALGNLDSNPLYAWSETDRAVSALMQSAFVNFIKHGDPNGAGVPAWPSYQDGQRLIIGAQSRAEPFTQRARYQAMEALQ